MQSIIILLFALSARSLGGLNKIENSKEINDVYMNNLIQKSRNQFYFDAMTNADLMTVEPIALYSQVVNGIKYKVIIATQAYANTRNEVQLHEYNFYQAISFQENSIPDLELEGEIKHFNSESVSMNSPLFSQANAVVSKYLMNSNNQLNFISDVDLVDVYGESYYVVKCNVKGTNIDAGFVLAEKNGQLSVVTRLN
jgi:hypothetical protein